MRVLEPSLANLEQNICISADLSCKVGVACEVYLVNAWLSGKLA